MLTLKISPRSFRFICSGRASATSRGSLPLVSQSAGGSRHELSRQRRLLFYVEPSRSELTTNARLSNRPCAQPSVERAAQYRDVVSERRAINQALFETVHRLRHAGMNASQIVRETAISRKRVDKWLRLPALPERNKMEPKVDSPALSRLPGAKMVGGMPPREDSAGRTPHARLYRMFFWITSVRLWLAHS
jgi:hypothetical protein